MLIGSWHNYYDHRFGRGKTQMRVIASQLETTIDVLVDVVVVGVGVGVVVVDVDAVVGIDVMILLYKF